MHVAPDAPAAPSAFFVTDEGRLRRTDLMERQRLIAVGLHLWWLALLLPIGPIAPAIPILGWLFTKRESEFLDDHGREVVNFGISIAILSVVLCLTVVGVLGLPVLWIAGLVGMVRGAIAAGRGEYFRYPMTFRLIG